MLMFLIGCTLVVYEVRAQAGRLNEVKNLFVAVDGEKATVYLLKMLGEDKTTSCSRQRRKNKSFCKASQRYLEIERCHLMMQVCRYHAKSGSICRAIS